MAGPKCELCGTPLTHPGLCGPCKRATDKVIQDMDKKKGGKGK